MLIFYELKKLLHSRFLPIVLAVLLGVNLFTLELDHRQYQQTLYGDQIPPETVQSFFEEYAQNPGKLDEEYQAIADLEAAYEQAQAEAFESGMSTGLPAPEVPRPDYPQNYISDGFTDKDLFDKYDKIRSLVEDYDGKVSAVIAQAEENQKTAQLFSKTDDNFALRYQQTVIDKYRALLDRVQLSLEYPHGWDRYFAYMGQDLLFYMFVLIVSAYLFLNEKSAGALSLLHLCKRGRARTAAAKFAAMAVVCFAGILLFTGETLLYDLQVYGFSSLGNGIQIFDEFSYSPYVLTVGGALLVSLLIRLLIALALGTVVCLFSLIGGGYPLCLGAGLCVLGGNYFLYRAKLQNGWNFFNIFSVSTLRDYLIRYRAVGIFGRPADALMLFLALLAVILFGGGATCLVLFCVKRPMASRRLPALQIKKNKAKKTTSRKTKTYAHSLLRFEMRKLRKSVFIPMLLLILLAGKLYYAGFTNSATVSYERKLYSEYFDRCYGEWTEAKQTDLDAALERINDIIACEQQMERAYQTGEIDYNTYTNYLSELSAAKNRQPVLANVVQRGQYLAERYAQSGIRGWFFDEASFRRGLGGELDPFLVLWILAIAGQLFVFEYQGYSGSRGFVDVMRTTRRGRSGTYFAKLWCALLCSLPAVLLFAGLDMAYAVRAYGAFPTGAPLFSIPLYAQYDGSMSVGGYLSLVMGVRLLSALLLVLFALALSNLLAHPLRIYPVTVAVLFLPWLFTRMGLSAFAGLDPTVFLSGDRLFLSLIAPDHMLWASAYLGAAILLPVGSFFYSLRKFTR